MARRIKNRYILAETSIPLDMGNIVNQAELQTRIMQVLGTIGYSYSNPKIMFAGEKQFILRVQRSSEESTVLALSFIKSINGRKLGICTIKTSGTIKSLKEALLK